MVVPIYNEEHMSSMQLIYVKGHSIKLVTHHSLCKVLDLIPHLRLASVVPSYREQLGGRVAAPPQSYHHHSPRIHSLKGQEKTERLAQKN